MPPATSVPAQQKLTAMNFGEKILLSCLLDSLSKVWELIVYSSCTALIWDSFPISFPFLVFFSDWSFSDLTVA
jgi:hypothetical protein